MPSGLSIDGIEAAKRALGSDVVNLSLSSALNKGAALGRTEISKSVRKKWNVKARDVRAATRIFKSTENRRIAILFGQGKRLPLIDFGAKQQQRGRKGSRKNVTSVKLTKSRGRTILKHAFIATMSSGHTGVFRRKGKARLPILERTGPAIPQMMSGTTQINSVIKLVNGRLPDLFETDLNHRINKALG